eukprot:scaffold451_cov365-Prasinococcus_capsulatus_cf.AAC.20
MQRRRRAEHVCASAGRTSVRPALPRRTALYMLGTGTCTRQPAERLALYDRPRTAAAVTVAGQAALQAGRHVLNVLFKRARFLRTVVRQRSCGLTSRYASYKFFPDYEYKYMYHKTAIP